MKHAGKLQTASTAHVGKVIHDLSLAPLLKMVPPAMQDSVNVVAGAVDARHVRTSKRLLMRNKAGKQAT
jgi:hypothetical protein